MCFHHIRCINLCMAIRHIRNHNVTSSGVWMVGHCFANVSIDHGLHPSGTPQALRMQLVDTDLGRSP